jgi:hypothetical protein
MTKWVDVMMEDLKSHGIGMTRATAQEPEQEQEQVHDERELQNGKLFKVANQNQMPVRGLRDHDKSILFDHPLDADLKNRTILTRTKNQGMTHLLFMRLRSPAHH